MNTYQKRILDVLHNSVYVAKTLQVEEIFNKIFYELLQKDIIDVDGFKPFISPILDLDAISKPEEYVLCEILDIIEEWMEEVYITDIKNSLNMENNYYDPEKTWEEFWKDIILNPDGTVNMDQLKKELASFKEMEDRSQLIYNGTSFESVNTKILEWEKQR